MRGLRDGRGLRQPGAGAVGHLPIRLDLRADGHAHPHRDGPRVHRRRVHLLVRAGERSLHAQHQRRLLRDDDLLELVGVRRLRQRLRDVRYANAHPHRPDLRQRDVRDAEHHRDGELHSDGAPRWDQLRERARLLRGEQLRRPHLGLALRRVSGPLRGLALVPRDGHGWPRLPRLLHERSVPRHPRLAGDVLERQLAARVLQLPVPLLGRLRQRRVRRGLLLLGVPRSELLLPCGRELLSRALVGSLAEVAAIGAAVRGGDAGAATAHLAAIELLGLGIRLRGQRVDLPPRVRPLAEVERSLDDEA